MAKNNSGEEKGKFSVEGKASSYILFIGLVEGNTCIANRECWTVRLAVGRKTASMHQLTLKSHSSATTYLFHVKLPLIENQKAKLLFLLIWGRLLKQSWCYEPVNTKVANIEAVLQVIVSVLETSEIGWCRTFDSHCILYF